MTENGGKVIISVIVLFVVFFLLPLSETVSRVKYPQDMKPTDFYVLDFIGIVQLHGRRAEWHNTTTEDGYILSIFRLIPSDPHRSSNWGPPIYLQHGLALTADMYALWRPERNIAFLLSDAGYDVWLGNLRGNVYSRQHQTLSPDDPKFWDFSMDEYATKDLPAMIDYILAATNRSTLSYLGISLGSTISTILLSHRTEYNEKLNLVIQFAPVTFFKSRSPIRTLLILTGDLMAPMGNAVEAFPQNSFITSLIIFLCSANDFMKEVCLSVMEAGLGRDREQLDYTWNDIVVLSRYLPAGSSAKVFFHYHQMMKTGRFGYFDHKDLEVNMRYYGQTEAPDYNLTNIVAPMALFKAPNDPLSTVEDNEALLSKLPPNGTVFYETIQWKDFNHIDFIVARDAKKLVYDRLFEILPHFNRFP